MTFAMGRGTTYTHAELKERHREIRDRQPENLRIRVHRAISWIGRAQKASTDGDPDAAFIFYWIAFNAIYTGNSPFRRENYSERNIYKEFFTAITDLDSNGMIYSAIWSEFSESIRIILKNKFVFAPYWRHVIGEQLSEPWDVQFERQNKKIVKAFQHQETQVVLNILFDRLYVLRNQTMHGGSTWNSSVNRRQIEDGTRILGFLIPIFVDLMMNDSDIKWQKPYYPVVSE